MTIKSLQDLNTYALTPITYTDVREAQVLFDRGATVDQNLTVSENYTFVFPWGINIQDITQFDVAQMEYEIDLSNWSSSPVYITWDYLPPHVTTSRAGNVFTVSNIRSGTDWFWVRQARVQPPFGFTGLIVHTGTLSWYADTAATVKTTASWDANITFNAVEYFSTAPDTLYTANSTQNNIPTTSIIADPDEFNPEWTLRIFPSDTSTIEEIFSDGSPGEATWNNSTKTFTIVGDSTSVNDILSTLDIEFARSDADFVLNFSLANNFTSTVELQVQQFFSRDFVSDNSIVTAMPTVAMNAIFRTSAPINSFTTANSQPNLIRDPNPTTVNAVASTVVAGNAKFVADADMQSTSNQITQPTRIFQLDANIQVQSSAETIPLRIRSTDMTVSAAAALTSNSFVHQGGLVATFDTTLIDNNALIELTFDNFNYPYLFNDINLTWIDGNGTEYTETITQSANTTKTATYPGFYEGPVTVVVEGNIRSTHIEALTSLDRWSDSTEPNRLELIFINQGSVPDYLPSSFTKIEFGQHNAMGGDFNAPELTSWDTSNVTDMSTCFQANIVFNQDISSWDTSAVTSMGAMFENAVAFNQNISSWDTSSVTNMQNMFRNNQAFDQNISGWNVSNVINYTNFDTNTNTNWTSAEKPSFNP